MPSTDELEHIIQSDILARLGCMPNIFCWRANAGKAHSEDLKRWVIFNVPGTADIIGGASPLSGGPGQFFGIEVKAAWGRQSTAQKAFERAMIRCNGLYILARDWETVQYQFRVRGFLP